MYSSAVPFASTALFTSWPSTVGPWDDYPYEFHVMSAATHTRIPPETTVPTNCFTSNCVCSEEPLYGATPDPCRASFVPAICSFAPRATRPFLQQPRPSHNLYLPRPSRFFLFFSFTSSPPTSVQGTCNPTTLGICFSSFYSDWFSPSWTRRWNTVAAVSNFSLG